MMLRRADTAEKTFERCHDGVGSLGCRELLADYRRPAVGFTYVHDDVLEPGATIGLHPHEGDEELYIVVEGTGVMTDDGEEHPIGPGDACLTRSGESHALANTGDGPLRLLVVNCRTGVAG